jgi:hypothetical protein
MLCSALSVHKMIPSAFWVREEREREEEVSKGKSDSFKNKKCLSFHHHHATNFVQTPIVLLF